MPKRTTHGFRRALITCALVISADAGADNASIQFHPENDGLIVPDGFQVSVVANGIGRARHLAVRDNGDIYVAMRQAHSRKCLAALRDEDKDGLADVIHYFGDFGECGSVELHGGYLYFSNLETVYRIALHEGTLVPTGPAEVVAKDFAPNGPWHNYKIIAFDESDNLYINVGSPSNSCQQKYSTPGSPGLNPCAQRAKRAGVWKFRAGASQQTQSDDGELFARGLRNSVALAWNPISKSLYAVPHGRDLLHHLWPEYYSEKDSAELPAEEFFRLHENFDGGWPYTYYDQQKELRMVAPEYGGDGNTADQSGQYDDPIVAFPGHMGPNDLIFYTGNQFPKDYYGGAFVVFVGGWNRAPFPQQGYKVVFIPFDDSGLPTGEPVTFVDNFAGKPEVAAPDEAQYRPTGMAQGPDGSLYVSDSMTGRIWRVVYTGKAGSNTVTSSIAGPESEAESKTQPQNEEQIAAVYLTNCASCHMSDGSGVPGFQPSLKQSSVINGEISALVKLILQGSSNEKENALTMPAFAHLDDETIAQILTYVRSHFGNLSEPVDSDAIRQHR